METTLPLLIAGNLVDALVGYENWEREEIKTTLAVLLEGTLS